MLHSYTSSPNLPLTPIRSTSLSLTTSSLLLSFLCSTIPLFPNPQYSFPSLSPFSLSFPLSHSVSPHLLISFPLPNGLTQPLLLSLYLSISCPISSSPNASPPHLSLSLPLSNTDLFLLISAFCQTSKWIFIFYLPLFSYP